MREFKHPAKPHIEGADTPAADEDAKKEDKKIADPAAEEASRRYNEFFNRYRSVIGSYFGREADSFTLKPGGWYVDLKTGRFNADPTFFSERGYGDSESLYCTFHEIEHFRDAARDPETHSEFHDVYLKELEKVHPAYPDQVAKLWNCVDDIRVNHAVDGRWKAGGISRQALYPKLFPSSDLTEHPKFRQFMYGLLRESMLPEPVAVDAKVREVMDNFNDRTKAKGIKTIDYITAFDQRTQLSLLSPAKRMEVFATVIEPMFRKLFLEDLKDLKDQQLSGALGGKTPGDVIENDPLEDVIPDALDHDDLLDQIEKARAHDEHEKKKKFKELMGVDKEDFEKYLQDYKFIEPYIDDLVGVFQKLIDERITYQFQITKPSKEGPMLDRSRIATGYAQLKGGNLEPEMFVDYESERRVERRPTRIELHLVVDGTGSVQSDNHKIMSQRRAVILFLESVARFRDMIHEQQVRGIPINLELATQVRQFGERTEDGVRVTDQVIQELSDTIDHVTRVKIHKTLTEGLLSGNNEESATFEALEDDVLSKQEALQNGDLKKIIITLTDGGTSVNMQSFIRSITAIAGPEHIAMGAIGYGSDGAQVKEIYAPIGVYEPDTTRLPKRVEDFLKKMLE